MLWRYVLTIGHPCINVRIGKGIVSIAMDSKGRISFSHRCKGRHLRIKPFRSVESTDAVERPLIGRGSFYLTVYTVYRGNAFVNDVTISKQGKVEQFRDEANEELARGLVMGGPASRYLEYMLDALIDRYLDTPTPVVIMSAKLTIDSSVIDGLIRPHALDDYASSDYRIYHSPGFMAAVKSITPHRSDITIISRIDRAESFKSAAMGVLLGSSIIHGITLGRSGKIPVGIDVFYPAARRIASRSDSPR